MQLLSALLSLLHSTSRKRVDETRKRPHSFAHMGQIILSILTPAIPERLHMVRYLAAEIGEQTEKAGLTGQVEHLIFCDTRGARSVGEKRDELVRMARGSHVAFVDDDDRILPNYVAAICAAISAHNPDVVTFRQRVTYCGQDGEIVFGLGNPNEPFAPNAIARRAPWHVCAFRRTLAQAHHFPHTNYGEDWAWARHVAADCATSAHIDAVLHHYIHDPATTAAPAPASAPQHG